MFADDMWSRCYINGDYGLWTAGQWEYPKYKSPFVWKVEGEIPTAMRYTNWHRGEPDNAQGNEACVNLWKNHRYTWSDKPCHIKYCFVCENYRVPIWGTERKSRTAWLLERCA